ncbi:sulfatase-like hydrolase/transferase [Sphingomonas sp. Leaf343]|uniref:sulfatase-like hydrolase/transferase n=1 Tax=Sphingomonas sp. Leaf343 TaxID=1736345 RepID=UPI0009E75237|nr:sulfatase-like hydrolase/transferase [Sphingomonas sp. Leaf343]
MVKRLILKALAATSLAALAGAPAWAGAPAKHSARPAAPPPQAPNVRPNILVFLADDLGYQDTTPWGDRNVRTPNLKALASSGMAFDRAFVASPACAPSRAALLTGLMPARNGSEANQQAPSETVRKLPSYLHDLGYQVVAFGKVSHYKQTGMYGFDHFEHDTFHDPEGVPSAIRWLKARKDKRPLAIFVGSNWPHVPWPKTTEGYDPAALSLPRKTVDTTITRNARARYYAAVSRLDQELGDTVRTVDDVLGKNTFVLFSSDHGAQWPFGKWNLYDTGTRVPLVVRWAGHVQAGQRTAAMVSWVDILPTLVAVAGGKPSAEIDGRSFAAALAPQSRFAGRSDIFTTHNNDGSVNVFPMRSVRTARWKYINNLHPEYVYTTHIDQFVNRVDSGVYFPSWRQAATSDKSAADIVKRYYHRPKEELYDLLSDPGETDNLASDPDKVATLQDLRKRLAVWRAQQHDDHPVEGTPHFEEGPIGGAPDPDARPPLLTPEKKP